MSYIDIEDEMMENRMTVAGHPPPNLFERIWGYYRREGFRPLIQRVAEEFQGWHPFYRNRVGAGPVMLVEQNPGAIHGHLDTPSDGQAEVSGSLAVSGWACAAAGLQTVILLIDDVPVKEIQTGLSRGDVKAHFPDIPDAARSGFATEIPIDGLQRGTHRLVVALKDRADNTRLIPRTFQRVENTRLYHAYYHSTLTSARELKDIKQQLAASPALPEIELWIDFPEGNDLVATLRSLREQEYPAWRCLILAGSVSRSWLEEVVATVVGEAGSERFMVVDRPPTEVVSGTGDLEALRYYGFLRAGELLAPHALYHVAARASLTAAEVIYSDHDHIQTGGRHVQPHFKPDWAPDYLLSCNYVGGFFLAKDTEALRAFFQRGIDTGWLAWRFACLLCLTDDSAYTDDGRDSNRHDDNKRIEHIPRVLWSAPATAQNDGVQYEEERRAVEDALKRRAQPAEVVEGAAPGIRRIRWQMTESPLVSIIIPTTGKLSHLQPCVASIREKTTYPNYELIFIDNGRGSHPEGIAFLESMGLRVLERNEPFNWAKLNNDGARLANGDLLLFLNDDVEVHEGDWLTELVRHARRPGVGAVGGLLFYPDGTIQHGGIFLVDFGGGAVHLFHGLDPQKEIYLNLNHLAREVIANTGACLMVHRDRFDEVGGFDEDLAIVGNDVDLCLRLVQRGYRNIWTPYSTLIHHESISRKDINIGPDEKKVWERWGDVLRAGDPYYNPNFATNRVDCSIAWYKVKNLADNLPEEDVQEEGINLIAYIRAEMGVGQAARGEASAMYEAGVPFTILDYSYGNPARMGNKAWLHKTTQQPVYGINLLHVNADLIPQAVSRLSDDVFKDRYTIGYWAWELPEFPDEWLSSFAMVDEVWVPSAFVQEAVSRKSPVPIVRIPHAITIPAGPFLERAHFGLPEGAYLFLTMYDVNSIPERKNPCGAIQAFVNSFAPDDGEVGLVLKVNNVTQAERRQIAEMTKDYRNIYIIDQVLDRHAVDSLHACCDCFLSLHRSEGFGLTLAESMGQQKPVIATHWSGNVDFMNPRNAACIDYELVQLGQDYGPYKKGQYWADPDLEQASWWMKRLREDPQVGRKLGAIARDTIALQLSPLSVGKMIGERIRYITRNAQ